LAHAVPVAAERRFGWQQWGLVILYGFLVAGYPLVSVLPVFLGIPSRVTSVPFRALVLGLSLAVATSGAMRSPRFYRGVLWAPLALFFVLYMYRLYMDTTLDPIALTMPASEYLTFGLGVTLIPMLPFFLPPEAAPSRAALSFALRTAVLASILVLAITVQQFRAGDLLALWAGRVGTETLNPISLGHLGASVVILATYCLVWDPPANAPSRILLLGALMLGLITTAVAASRGPMLAGVAALAALWLLPLRRRTRAVMLAVTVTLVLFGIGLAVRAEDELGIPLVSRVTALAEARADVTVGLRITFIQDAWSQFMEHPILGSALEERNSMGYPHNIHVEAFMATGLFGGLSLLTLTVAGLWASIRLLRRDPGKGWIALMYVQSLVGAATSGSIVGSASFYAFLAAVVSTASQVDAPSSA
jgi:hypothetical protein